ncbi:uncharacterized protein LOC132735391 isoform X2 [Ruditapes philippinarum]|uniref:uncharacterized protein LOC132735391 isoform X2 n=1 Tax=Ruditapes philippinarum TaxID=129788 RepID=UPI00295BD004|nr:uncharacterized protein LOC132735391 isoform X2 [Ruditapes philippinarum]
MIRMDANNPGLIFIVLWTVLVLLNMMRNTYLAYNYEMGLCRRFVLCVMSVVPWALTVIWQILIHRQLIREGDPRQRN